KRNSIAPERPTPTPHQLHGTPWKSKATHTHQYQLHGNATEIQGKIKIPSQRQQGDNSVIQLF
ncbi:hypothetical protein TY91_14630, partial [Secundilactobacillus collinoides]